MNKTIILAAIVLVSITVVAIAVTQLLIPVLSPTSPSSVMVITIAAITTTTITIPSGKNNKEEVIDRHMTRLYDVTGLVLFRVVVGQTEFRD
jgi:hypothetical protein